MTNRRPVQILAALIAVGGLATAGVGIVRDNAASQAYQSLHEGTTLGPVDPGAIEGSHLHHLPGEKDGPSFYHGHAGAPQELGTAPFGDFDLKAVQIGPADNGGIATFEFELNNVQRTPEYVHAWIGTPDAAQTPGGLVSQFDATQGGHTHLQMPATPAKDTALWVEYINERGDEIRTSYTLK